MGPLKNLFQDPDVTEIMVDGPGKIRVEKRGVIVDTDLQFSSRAELEALINSLHSENQSSGPRESRLPDGSRAISFSGTAAIDGPFLLIAKVLNRSVSWENFVEWKFASHESTEILRAILAQGKSVIAAGTQGSGRLTALRLFASEIRPISRVIAIEGRWPFDIRKSLPHVNVLYSGGAPKLELVVAARSLRPDAIVLDELVGTEAHELMEAALDEIQVLSTIRASSVAGALRRIELLCQQSNVAWSIADHREQIAESLPFVTFQERLRRSGRRVLREISQVTGFENGQYRLEPLVRWNESVDKFEISKHGRTFL